MTTPNEPATSREELALIRAEAQAKQPAPPRPMPTLGDAAYHGLAGDIVRQLEPNTEAHPAALLMQLLAAFGNAVGTGPYFLIGPERHHARINVVVVGASALGRKGTSWNNVSTIFETADPDWARHRIKGGLASGEGLIKVVSDSDEEDAPPVDKRFLAKESEFARVLQVARREGSTVSHIIRDAFDSGHLGVITRNNPLEAHGAHISVVGHITPDELTTKLTDLDMANGFANRFLFAMVERTKRLPHGGALGEDDYRAMGQRVRRALQDARPISRIGRDEDARDRWAHLYELIEQQARLAPALVEEVTSRADVFVNRLAMAYALLDGASKITVAHLDAAWAVWSFSRESVEYLFGDRTGLTKADRVVQAIRSAGGRLDRTGIYRALDNHVEANELDVLVDVLVRDGRVVPEKVETGGRPRTDYVLVDAVAA